MLDLKPPVRRNRLDFHTLIGQRAIATDPAVVGAIASAYVRGLEESGVGATLKHFPGIGRVRTDTHHFSANLDTPVRELEATDWLPFREVLSHSRSAIMVGHVTLTAVDPDRAASHSKRVVEGVIRDKWGYQGVVMTDDLVMGAIYQHDVCQAVVEAINAGVDCCWSPMTARNSTGFSLALWMDRGRASSIPRCCARARPGSRGVSRPSRREPPHAL